MPEIKDKTELKKTIPTRLVIIFLFFSVGIILIGFIYYRSQSKRIYTETQNNLTAISELKTNQIEQWYNERLGYATIIKDNEPLIRSISQYFGDRGNPILKKELTKWMESVCAGYDYNGVSIVDNQFNPIISVSLADTVKTNSITGKLTEALETDSVIFTDLHRTENEGEIHIDILIPLVEPGTENQRPFGIMILRIDPGKLLFPLVQSWPTPSRTAETLLLRKEGDSILFLNELRHKNNTALIMKLPLNSENVLGVKAVQGFIGIAEGVDYRNIPVFGYLSKINGLPWYMVTKIDRDEMLFILKRHTVLTLVVIILMIVINALIFGFFIWNQIVKSYRKQLTNEQAIREADEKFKYVFDHSVIGKAITYPSGEIHVNKAFCDMLGYTSEELTNGKWEEITHPDDIEMTHEFLNLLDSGETDAVRFNKRYIHKNGSIVWGDVSTALRRDTNNEPMYFMATITDITENKIAESKIRELNEELEKRVIQRTEQLEAANKELEAFSYSVSHDLRSPLRSVHAFTKILMEDYGKVFDEEGKRICGIITSSATQMGELIDDLLSFSRIGRSHISLTSINMRKLAASVFEETIPANKKNGTIFKIGRLPKIYGDPNLIKLVWVNLISNAVKYSSKERISEIIIGSKIEEGVVVYSITDNGVGFDMQYINKLFGVFQRLHSFEEFEGNGVGLAIVKRIILRHNGKVWAEGEVGKGASFYFSLPQ